MNHSISCEALCIGSLPLLMFGRLAAVIFFLPHTNTVVGRVDGSFVLTHNTVAFTMKEERCFK